MTPYGLPYSRYPPAYMRVASCWLLSILLSLSACAPEPVEDVPEPAEAAVARGDSAFQQLQFAQANDEYSTAIRLDSTLAHAFLMRGQVRWMSQQFGPAVEDLDRALALDSTQAWGYFFRGSSYFSLDSLDLALADLQTAATSGDLPDEDRARAHRMRAIVFMSTDRYEEGIDALSRAIDLRPDAPLYLFERGLLNAAADRPAEATSDLERFLANRHRLLAA